MLLYLQGEQLKGWVPRDTPKCPSGGCFWDERLGSGEEAERSRCCGIILMCVLSQQKRISCHLCQVAVSAVGKILQDNCTEVSHGWGSVCPPSPLWGQPNPELSPYHLGKAAALLG